MALLLGGTMTNWKLVLTVAVLSLMPIGGTNATAQPPSHFVRQSPNVTTLIVFVHGVIGDGQSTWTKGTAYWPTLLSSDAVFDGADIFVYSYPTALWATLSPDELAENMRL